MRLPAWVLVLVAACGSAHHTTDANIIVPGDTLVLSVQPYDGTLYGGANIFGVDVQTDIKHSLAELFAELFAVYESGGPENKEVITSMVGIFNDPKADPDERMAALDTLAEVLFQGAAALSSGGGE